jgi:hypothetical protein
MRERNPKGQVTADEIEKVVLSFNRDKAPGLGGFGPG